MDTIVRTSNGRVRGRTIDGVSAFLGVSYAAPPVGANRLRPPQPVDSWAGVRDATALGPEPPQPQFDRSDATGMLFDPAVPGDDCLNLNIWTPDPGAAGLPVMVWSPGGAFRYNSGGSYDGSRFARDGVVCVTINWRTGADGFLYLGEDDDANLGLLDQVAALTWVRDHIGAFGGDPGQVTLFGESAGAMSIGDLLSMPRAAGLFRRAILQSGAAHHVVRPADAAQIGARLAEVLGVPAARDTIAGVPVERFLEAQAQIDAEVLLSPDPARWGREVVASVMPFHPVVDGDVVADVPIERIAAGAGADVDVLVGTNSDDWRLFPVLGGFIDQVTDEMLSGPVEVYGSRCMAAFGLPAETALPAYRSAHPDGSPGDLLAAVLTDWWIRVPAVRLADAHAAAPAGTFMYEFAWPSPAFGGRLGACHGLEIPFVFDTLDLGHRQMLGGALGDKPPQELADFMHAAWVDFAARGDPGWPRYDLQRRATMRFDVDSSVIDDPYARERELWAGVR
jgi:para-nitrobenzyl esterase